MSKIFGISDIFIDVTLGVNGDVFIETCHTPDYLDNEIYWDKKKIEEIKERFHKVEGKQLTYWITGNIFNEFDNIEDKKKFAKKFALWYHENRGKIPVIDFNN